MSDTVDFPVVKAPVSIPTDSRTCGACDGRCSAEVLLVMPGYYVDGSDWWTAVCADCADWMQLLNSRLVRRYRGSHE